MNCFKVLVVVIIGMLALPAATVQVDYPSFRGTALGDALVNPIITGDEELDQQVDAQLERILITWQGRKCPPTVRYLGVPALQVMAALPAEAKRITSPFGPAVALAKHDQYTLTASAMNELVVATEKRMPQLELGEWPVAPPHPLVIDAAPDDFKLGKAAEWLTGLQLVWRSNHKVSLTGQSKTGDDATNVKSYVNRRLPWLHAAAAVGVDKAEFPSKLFDDKKLKRYGARTSVSIDLSKQSLRDDSMEHLAKLITKQMRKYRKY